MMHNLSIVLRQPARRRINSHLNQNRQRVLWRLRGLPSEGLRRALEIAGEALVSRIELRRGSISGQSLDFLCHLVRPQVSVFQL